MKFKLNKKGERNMNRKELVKQFTEAVKRMKQTHENGTYHWSLDVYNHNQWAIVLGWADGFEEGSMNFSMKRTITVMHMLLMLELIMMK